MSDFRGFGGSARVSDVDATAPPADYGDAGCQRDVGSDAQVRGPVLLQELQSASTIEFFLADCRMLAYSHFRDGNVPDGYQQLDAFKRALAWLPAGIKGLKVRMDTQGYGWELLRHLAEGKNERFGVIEFAVGADVTQELKKEVTNLRADQWKDLARQPGQVAQQWAQVPFVPDAASTKKGRAALSVRRDARSPGGPAVAWV